MSLCLILLLANAYRGRSNGKRPDREIGAISLAEFITVRIAFPLGPSPLWRADRNLAVFDPNGRAAEPSYRRARSLAPIGRCPSPSVIGLPSATPP